jgi:hypothetical protein
LPGALLVEMAGVEPASEERTTAMCYVPSRSFRARFHRTDRQDRMETTPLVLSPDVRRELARPVCLESTPSQSPTDEAPQDGLPNYLSSQCVVVVGTSGFPLYLRATRRARYAIPTIPFPVETRASPKQLTIYNGQSTTVDRKALSVNLINLAFLQEKVK